MNAEQRTDHTLPEIKSQTADQLFVRLVAYETWAEDDVIRITDAFGLAAQLHVDDTHRGKPYVYHLLRVANRIASPHHLDTKDADLVIAALLHDTVEDHADGLIQSLSTDMPAYETYGRIAISESASQHAQAFSYINRHFGSRVADMVEAVTNPQEMDRESISKEDKYEMYQQKLQNTVRTLDGWILKFADFVDNAVGIIYSEGEDPSKIQYRKRKYRPAISVFQSRLDDTDVQFHLSDDAKEYVVHKLQTAESRLAD